MFLYKFESLHNNIKYQIIIVLRGSIMIVIHTKIHLYVTI